MSSQDHLPIILAARTHHISNNPSRAEAAKAWFEEVISDGVQSIKDALKVLEHIKGVEERLHDMIAFFNHETNTLKEDLGIRNQMVNSDLDVFISYDIIPSPNIFYGYQGLMVHKAQVMEKLLTKLQGALKGYQAVEMEIMSNLRHMGCKVLTRDDNLFMEEEII